MNDRSTAWRHLLPAGAVIEDVVNRGERVPDRAPNFLPGPDTLVVPGSALPDRAACERYRSIVVTRPSRGTAAMLERHGFRYTRSFAVAPSLRRPRWYLPLGCPPATRRALDLYSPATPLGRGVRAAARLAVAFGGGALLGERLTLASRERSPVEAALAGALGGVHFHVCMSLPHETGQRDRIWLLAIDDSGAARAFAKFGYGPSGIRAVEREAQLTRHVADLGFRTMVIPPVLGAARVDAGFLMVSSTLAAGSRESPGDLTPAHLAALGELAGHAGPGTADGLVDRLAERLERAAPHLSRSWVARLGRAAEAVAAGRTVRDLPTVLAHGDFVPWNTRLLPETSRLAVFDWEQGQETQFPLWDAFNFLAQGDILLRRLSPAESVRRATELLRSTALAQALSLTRDQVTALQLAYLADASLRWFEGHHPPSVWEYEMTLTRTQPMRAAMLDAALSSAFSSGDPRS